MQGGSRKEMQMSPKDMADLKGSRRGKGCERVWKSGKEMQGGSRKEMQMSQRDLPDLKGRMHEEEELMEELYQNMRSARLVDALSCHREILRRENSFLMRAVRSRNLSTVAGKISYLESQFNSEPPLSIQPISEVSVQKMDSSEIKVSLPYLVSNREEALDFLLHESLLLGYRIESLASIVKEFNIPISSRNANMLLIMSRQLVSISRRIMRSDVSNSREERKAMSREGKEAISPEGKEAISYDKHRLGWKSTWGSETPNYGFFNDITTLSPMQFTCSTPGIYPHAATTGPALHIYSIRIVDLNANLDWPLYVWGVVAARDVVDRNRNILFCRSLANCQKVTQDDPYLCLTGPSRAISAAEDVTFEVELQMKYGLESRHTAVLAGDYSYHSVCDENPEIARGCCTAKLRLEQIATALQATIVGVQVEGGWLPFQRGCQVFCSSFAAGEVIRVGIGIPNSRKNLLLDAREPVVSHGYIRLSRNVVSVKSGGILRIAIRDYSGCGDDMMGHMDFPVKHCKTSEQECFVGGCKVKIVVAWSLLVTNKENLMVEGYVPL